MAFIYEFGLPFLTIIKLWKTICHFSCFVSFTPVYIVHVCTAVYVWKMRRCYIFLSITLVNSENKCPLKSSWPIRTVLFADVTGFPVSNVQRECSQRGVTTPVHIYSPSSSHMPQCRCITTARLLWLLSFVIISYLTWGKCIYNLKLIFGLTRLIIFFFQYVMFHCFIYIMVHRFNICKLMQIL